tara:strand:- start:361 stop:657 length:297 start_codon:yes stop_codon:yes gene_type:complete
MTRRRNPLATKTRKIAKLATKALKNKIRVKPAKGYKYLKDCSPGSIFKTQSGLKGILIECTVNAKVIIIDAPSVQLEDANYYLGKHNIGAETEVKEIT